MPTVDNARLLPFDWALKKRLRNVGNHGVLEGFLSELFNDNIKIKQIFPTGVNGEARYPKTACVDMIVENSLNESIIVEIQCKAGQDFLQRMLLGVSRALAEYLSEHIGKDVPVPEITKVISISLVDSDLGQGEDYAYQGKTEFIGLNKKDILKLDYRDQERYKTWKISDIYPEYYILKYNEYDDIPRTPLDEWVYFLKNRRIESYFSAKGLKEAAQKLDTNTLTPEERDDYDAFLANPCRGKPQPAPTGDGKNGEEIHIHHQEWIAAIENKKAIDVADAMRKAGEPIEKISLYTGLTTDEIAVLS